MTAPDTSREAVDRLAAERDAARAEVTDVLAENDALRFDRNNLRAEVARQHKLWRTAAGISNECTWNRSTRAIADRLQRLIREAFEGAGKGDGA